MAAKKVKASFGGGRKNEETLGEAHALASLHKAPSAAAAVHQLIAACMSEAGYSVMAYPCSYEQHYETYPSRCWPADRAALLDKRLHDLARLAIENRTALEATHRRCFPDYTRMPLDQRAEAAIRFRVESRSLFFKKAEQRPSGVAEDAPAGRETQPPKRATEDEGPPSGSRASPGDESVLTFYATVTGCALSCATVVNNPQGGDCPRGFYFAGKHRHAIDLLVIAQNPGSALEGEKRLYGGTPVENAANALAFARQSFAGSGTTFHRALQPALLGVLGLTADELFERVAYTNLVKCTPTQKDVGDRTRRACYQSHLTREIRFFEPRAILALGSEVRDFLTANPPDQPWFYLLHPSSLRFRKENAAVFQRQVADLKTWWAAHSASPSA